MYFMRERERERERERKREKEKEVFYIINLTLRIIEFHFCLKNNDVSHIQFYHKRLVFRNVSYNREHFNVRYGLKTETRCGLKREAR